MVLKDKFLLNERLRQYPEWAEYFQSLASSDPDYFKKDCASSTQTSTECGSKIGIAVSLIDGVIAILRILWMMDLSSKEVQEALKDLKDSHELDMLTSLETETPGGRMLDEEWRKR